MSAKFPRGEQTHSQPSVYKVWLAVNHNTSTYVSLLANEFGVQSELGSCQSNLFDEDMNGCKKKTNFH